MAKGWIKFWMSRGSPSSPRICQSNLTSLARSLARSKSLDHPLNPLASRSAAAAFLVSLSSKQEHTSSSLPD